MAELSFSAANFRTGEDAMQTDHELLALYLQHGPEADAAFGALVSRHTDMVYAVCLRIVRDPHRAEDAAQAAFLVLVQRARSIGRGEGIGGWLYRVAVNAARNTQRVAVRRERHEHLAAQAEKASVSNLVDRDATVDLATLNAELDSALNALPRAQRDAVVVRCLQGRSQAQAAAELGCPAETVHTRVNRGLEKLRALLTRRDVRLSAAALLLLLEKSSRQTAPANLSSSIQAACLGKAAASVTATAIAMEVANKMVWMKLTTLAACAAILMVGIFLLKSSAATRTTERIAPVVAAPAVAQAPSAPASALPPNQPVTVGAKVDPSSLGIGSGATESMRLDLAINGGLRWLAKAQEADGHFDCKKFGGAADQDVAVTSIAALSMLGAGHTAKVGGFKANVQKAIQWLEHQRPTDITQSALRTIALAESFGMSGRGEDFAQAAIDDLISRQSITGEWVDESGSGPFARTIGPTTWALLALKSGKVAQLNIPKEVMESAVGTFDGQQREVFLNEDNLEGAKMAAALAVERQFYGESKDSPKIKALLRVLPRQRPAYPTEGIGHEVVLWWQGALAMFQQGGTGWSDWSVALKDALLPSQITEGELAGSWEFRQGSDPFVWGRIGSTSLATLPLEVHARYLHLQPDLVERKQQAFPKQAHTNKDSGF